MKITNIDKRDSGFYYLKIDGINYVWCNFGKSTYFYPRKANKLMKINVILIFDPVNPTKSIDHFNKLSLL